MNPSHLIQSYFPDLTPEQIVHFDQLDTVYRDWNAKINVISRKDIDLLYEHHVLHSLGIAKIVSFKPGARILDVGTGGGFPGIPLAILFPEAEFVLVDSIGKKIKVLNEVVQALGLKNVKALNCRVETLTDRFDFIVSRAVTDFPEFHKWVRPLVARRHLHDVLPGILYLKGGDLGNELQQFPKAVIYELKEYFKEEYFATKKVVHLHLKAL